MSISLRTKKVLYTLILGAGGNALWAALRALWNGVPQWSALWTPNPTELAYSIAVAAIGVFIGSRLAPSATSPMVVPLRYGKFGEGVTKTDGRWQKPIVRRQVGCEGLFLKNEREASAFDLNIPPVMVGASQLRIENGATRLAKEDGELFFAIEIRQGTGNSIIGGLFDEMRMQNVSAIQLSVIYKDAMNRWWETVFTVERNVLSAGGLDLRFVEQRRRKAPKTTSAG